MKGLLLFQPLLIAVALAEFQFALRFNGTCSGNVTSYECVAHSEPQSLWTKFDRAHGLDFKVDKLPTKGFALWRSQGHIYANGSITEQGTINFADDAHTFGSLYYVAVATFSIPVNGSSMQQLFSTNGAQITSGDGAFSHATGTIAWVERYTMTHGEPWTALIVGKGTTT